jgi:hypothetical protein
LQAERKQAKELFDTDAAKLRDDARRAADDVRDMAEQLAQLKADVSVRA